MIDIQRLRALLAQATPGPLVLATSNSWRRIVGARSVPVCEPTKQSDGHADLHFPNGGAEGADAQLLIEARNVLPSLLDELEQLRAERLPGAWEAAFPAPIATGARTLRMEPTPAMLRAIMGCETEEDALLGWRAALQAAPAAHAPPVEMGHGTVAVGTCTRSTDGMPGIVYLRIPGTPREHGADCADLFEVGAPPPQGSVLACVYFLTAGTLQQSIDTLREIQAQHYPQSVPDEHPSVPAQPPRPSSYVNGAGILASDGPGEVVKRLDAAGSSAGGRAHKDADYADLYRWLRDQYSPVQVMIHGVDTGLANTELDEAIRAAMRRAGSDHA